MEIDIFDGIAVGALLLATGAFLGALCNKILINGMQKQIVWLLREITRGSRNDSP